MARVWLIRHGESEANAGLVTGKPANIKLTAKGHQQAKQIASAFTNAPSLIVTSPFLRTKETAQPTIERFAIAPSVEWQIQEFNYLADSRRQNTTLEQRKPLAEDYWSRGDINYCDGEGAESFAAMMERVRDLRTKIQSLDNGLNDGFDSGFDDEFVVIFTHGLFMRIFMWSLLANVAEVTSETMKNVKDFLTSFQIANGAILPLQIQPRSPAIWMGQIIDSHLIELKYQKAWED